MTKEMYKYFYQKKIKANIKTEHIVAFEMLPLLNSVRQN